MCDGSKAVALLCLVILLFAGLPSVNASTAVDGILSKKTPLSRDDLERIYQFKLDRGAENLSVAACFLIRASKRFLQEGKREPARAYAEYAVKIAPDYAPAHTHLAVVTWNQHKLSLDTLFQGLYGYLRATATNYFSAALPLITLLFVFLLSVLMTIAVFALVSLYKYFKLFAHDLGHLLPALVPKHFPVGCAVLVFSLPLFFQWSIFITSFYWLFLLFLYHSRKEQQLIIIFTLFFSLSPFLLQALSQLTVTNASKEFYYTYQVNEDNWGGEAAQALSQRVQEHPYDSDALFSLALLNKREGRINEAQGLYARLLELEPLNCRVWCNAGNAYLAEKKLDDAITHYSRSVALCPDSVEGYYNLSRAQLLEYMFADSKKNFNRAKALNPGLVDTFLQRYSENINRLVIDQTIPVSEFWQRTFIASAETDALNATLWDFFYSGMSYTYRYGLCMVFLLFVVLLFIDRHHYNLSLACEYCGCAVCRKCKRLVLEYKLCRHCAGIFKSTGDIMISISNKEAQVASVERFQVRKIFVGKIISILLPGSGHLLFDHPFRGTVMLLLFFMLVSKLLLWNAFVVNPWMLISGTVYLGILMAVIPLGILYLYSLGHFNFSSMKLFQFLSLIRVTRRELQIKE